MESVGPLMAKMLTPRAERAVAAPVRYFALGCQSTRPLPTHPRPRSVRYSTPARR
jgi:hypothetical protein